MSDVQPPSELAPPAPPAADPATTGGTAGATADVAAVEVPVEVTVEAGRQARSPRPGQLTAPWRLALILTWIGAFLAYMAVWKTSEELGLATWWLGPRSTPQPVVVRVIPFAVIAVFGILATYNVRRLSWISLGGAGVLALIAVPDLSRATGIATVEFTIAAAVALVSVASFTGTYRAVVADADR